MLRVAGVIVGCWVHIRSTKVGPGLLKPLELDLAHPSAALGPHCVICAIADSSCQRSPLNGVGCRHGALVEQSKSVFVLVTLGTNSLRVRLLMELEDVTTAHKRSVVVPPFLKAQSTIKKS